MVAISQAESNNIKACALPSIHLPLTREASVMVQSKEWCGFWKVVRMADFCVWWVCRGGACHSRWIDVCDFLIVLNLSSIKGKMQFLFALDFFWIVYYNYNDVSGGASPAHTKSDGDSVYAKQTERLLKGKGGGAGRRDCVVLEGLVRRDDGLNIII